MDRGASRGIETWNSAAGCQPRQPGEEQHCTHRDCRVAGWVKFRANHCIYFTIRQKLALCIVTQYMFPMRFQIFGLFFCILALHSQTPLGTVSGLAVDASGGAVTAASVTLTNNDTGVRRTAVTNSSGAYAFPDLPPGTYRLGADAKGFRPIETRAFPVEAYRTVRQDLKFEVASTSTEVVVTEAASAVVQLESPAVGSSLAPRQIIETPTNLRSVSKNSGDSGLISSILPLTVPGVVQVGSGAKWLTPGAGATSVKVKVDGIETTFGNFGSPDNVSQPSVEAIQEFTANLLTTRAEFGGMGTITTATKSGANAYHGSLFWYLRNSGTDAPQRIRHH